MMSLGQVSASGLGRMCGGRMESVVGRDQFVWMCVRRARVVSRSVSVGGHGEMCVFMVDMVRYVFVRKVWAPSVEFGYGDWVAGVC